MILEYEGVDISDDVQIDTAWHDSFGLNRSDRLILRLSDVDDLWDKWGPKEGDKVKVSDGSATTGTMYIESIRPESSLMRVRALSMPPKADKERRSKSWEEVMLSQLIQEVCTRWGLGYRTFGFTDYKYSYVEQMDVADFKFLSKRLAYEGMGFLVYDGDLVVYSIPYMDSQTPLETIAVHDGMDFTFTNERDNYFGSCEVTDGSTQGRFTLDANGRTLTRIIDGRISSQAEAERFAQNLLRYQNRTVKTLRMVTETFLRQFAAGSVFNVDAKSAQSWNGPAIIEHMRLDYVYRRSTVWARRTITDY